MRETLITNDQCPRSELLLNIRRVTGVILTTLHLPLVHFAGRHGFKAVSAIIWIFGLVLGYVFYRPGRELDVFDDLFIGRWSLLRTLVICYTITLYSWAYLDITTFLK